MKEGAVVEARFWPEPVEIDRVEEDGVYVRILGATTKSRQHIDQMLTREEFAELSSKVQAIPFTAEPWQVFDPMRAQPGDDPQIPAQAIGPGLFSGIGDQLETRIDIQGAPLIVGDVIAVQMHDLGF